MTWANRITLFRILLIPVFAGALLYYAQSDRHGMPDERLRYLAFALFLTAAVSDGIDGYLARHWNQRTQLGAFLDPLADKLLALTALLSLSLIGFRTLPTFPLWFPLLVISRDVLLAGGALTFHLLHHPFVVRHHWTGKVPTGFFFAALQEAKVIGDGYDAAYLRAALGIVKEKIKLGKELADWLGYFFQDNYAFDPAAVGKVFTPEGLANLEELRQTLAAAPDFGAAPLEEAFKTLAAAHGKKVGAYIHPVRLAASGRSVGPSLYHLLEVLGKERVLARIDRALEKFKP